MKLMKHITIALVLCAIPAMAVGQTTVKCDVCTHQVSVYMGKGGVIATADDADEVSYLASCDGVTRTGTLDANDDGVVMTAFDDMTMLQCDGDDEDNKFEIGPVMDGGWFWIHVGENAAAGNLVDKNILDNDEVTITDAGESITTTDGDGAVLLRHTTGLVGILPTILPEVPEVEVPATLCGAGAKGATPGPASAGATKNCMLGNGATKLRTIGPVNYTTGPVSSVVRPYTGTVTVTVDAWLDTDQGIYASVAGQEIEGRTDALDVQGFAATPKVAGDGPGIVRTLDDVSVSAGGLEDNEAVTYTISPSSTFCGTATAPKSHTVTLTIEGTVTAEVADDFIPNIADANSATTASGIQTASTMVDITCPSPSSSSAAGVDLVPENLFPVE